MGVVLEWMPVRLPPDVYVSARSKNTVPLEDDVLVVHDMFHHVEADYAVERMVRKTNFLPGTTVAKRGLARPSVSL